LEPRLYIGHTNILRRVRRNVPPLRRRVTVLHTGKQIVSREDPEITAEMQTALEAEGIQFMLTRPHTTRVENKNGAVTFLSSGTEAQSSVTGSASLIATGTRFRS